MVQRHAHDFVTGAHQSVPRSMLGRENVTRYSAGNCLPS